MTRNFNKHRTNAILPNEAYLCNTLNVNYFFVGIFHIIPIINERILRMNSIIVGKNRNTLCLTLFLRLIS